MRKEKYDQKVLIRFTPVELIMPSNKHEFYKSLINFPNLTNPLLLEEEGDGSYEDEFEGGVNPDFLFDYDNDEDPEIDYEGMLRDMRAAKEAENNDGNDEEDYGSGAETDGDTDVDDVDLVDSGGSDSDEDSNDE